MEHQHRGPLLEDRAAQLDRWGTLRFPRYLCVGSIESSSLPEVCEMRSWSLQGWAL